MDIAPSPHPTDQTLSSFGLGKLDDGAAEAVDKHLEGCSACRDRVVGMSSDSFLDRVRDARNQAGAGTEPSTFGQSQPGATQGQKGPVTPPPADTLPPGLADHPDYRVERELGRGGMGVVYLAHNALMGRDEVLKVMGRQIIERPGVLERFLREIRAVARLRHPNIVTAYSATRFGESIVFAMEYVEGLDLAKLVKARGPLPVAHACHFAYQAALGLQHAHEEDLVHRDIKPANLMLSRKGEKATVKVLDFGLAKVAREEKVDAGLTSVGQALGTPDFIAPEQILDAQNADIRADIYSLGGTLYYLLTGRPPFQANSLYDMYQAHISRDADPLNLVRPEIPSELAALVAKMMAKDPARRFQTPGEVARALAPFFKKAAGGSKPDLSAIGGDTPRRDANPKRVTPHATAGDTPGEGVRPRTPAEPAAGSLWDELIDTKPTGPSGGVAQPFLRTTSPVRAGKPPWFKTAAVKAAVFGFLVVAGVIIVITTRDGKVVVKDPLGATKVTVAEGVVTVEPPSPDAPINPATGESPPPDAGPSPADKAVLARLDQRVALKFAKETPFLDVLKSIRSATRGPDGPGLPIYVDPSGWVRAQKTSRTPITIDVEGVPLRTTLPMVLRQLGFAYGVKDGLVFISMPDLIEPELNEPLAVADDDSPQTRAVLATLAQPVVMDFVNETPFGDVLRYVKEATKGPSGGAAIPIFVDPLALQKAEKTMNSPVMTLFALEGVPLRTTLRLLLKQVGLAYHVKDGLLVIDTGGLPVRAGETGTPVVGMPPMPLTDTVELIKNPGCEEKGEGIGIPAWTGAVGDWTAAADAFPPFEGKAYFAPGGVAYAELYQDVDVSRFARAIDAGTQAFRFSAGEEPAP